MRDSMKITVPYQFVHILLAHLGAVSVAFVFQTVAFWYFIGTKGCKEVLAIVFSAIYAGMIYHSSRKLSLLDHKSYTPLKPSVLKGTMFGVNVAVITLVLFVLWKLAWINSADETGLVGVGLVINFIFSFWTFPYYGILGASNGEITIIGGAVMLIVPILASTAGYLAGKYKLDLLDVIERFSYEKEDE